MAEPDPRDSAGILFRRLAEVIYAQATFDEIYQALCSAAPRLVSGCDRASLMIADGGRYVTAAASDETARQVDSLERQTGQGPCVDAISDEAAQLVSDLSVASPWPDFSEQVLSVTPVRGAAGFRLLVDDRKVGALNVFSDTPGALTRESADQATVLAAFASVSLSAAAHRERADSLQRGLESNREIAKAVGLLMAFYKISSEEALGKLRRTSQDLNVKMAEVAREVVQHHDRR